MASDKAKGGKAETGAASHIAEPVVTPAVDPNSTPPVSVVEQVRAEREEAVLTGQVPVESTETVPSVATVEKDAAVVLPSPGQMAEQAAEPVQTAEENVEQDVAPVVAAPPVALPVLDPVLDSLVQPEVNPDGTVPRGGIR